MSLIGRFSEGQHKVTAGGEERVIEFEAPRTLLGLAPFFEREGLKANDRVLFEFDGDRLTLSAEKRERPRSSASRTAGSPLATTNTGSQSANAGGSSSAGEGRITRRGLFPAPARLTETPPTPAEPGGAPEQHQERNDRHAAAEEGRGSKVNAVRRVRIEGGLPPRSDTVTPRPVDRASAHEVWARRQRPAWRSLDTMIAGPVVPPEEAAEAFSESTVRVVRRSKGTSTPLEIEVPPTYRAKPEEAEAAPAEEASYSMSWPLPETPREKRSARPADGPPTRPHAQDEASAAAPAAPAASARASLDPYLDAPIDGAREAGYTPPTILESDLLSVPGGRWRSESEEAYLKYHEAQTASAAEPVAVPAERKQGILGRLGLGRGGRSGGSAERSAAHDSPGKHQTPSPAARPQPRTDSPEAASGPDSRANETAEAAAGEGSGGAEEPESTRSPYARSPDVTSAAGAAPGRRVIVDDSVYDVDFDTDVAPHLSASEADTSSLESDMRELQEYLHRPDVPAIVRCEDLAARLQMSQERVSNAMFRLAEDRERYTPLRGDAYMVRRVR